MKKKVTYFLQKVDLRNRKAMVGFLTNHFRYPTMHSWNVATSYANLVKIHRLPLTPEQVNRAFEIREAEEFYEPFNDVMREFDERCRYQWQVGFNGRSQGYVVLYRGGRRDTGHKSRCTACGQLNYKTVEETRNSRCGRCGEDARVNLERPMLEAFSYPGKAVDQGENFAEWDSGDIRDRVRLVLDFDHMCDRLLNELLYLVDHYKAVEKTICVPKTIKVMQERKTVTVMNKTA